jgi:ribonuclease HII
MRSLFEQHFRRQENVPAAGVDEAGVGAWAGPVLAAAVILLRDFSLAGLNDSKLLSARRRAALFDSIRECAVAVGVGQVEVADIDRLNIYWAAMLARKRAVEALMLSPAQVLVDGRRRIRGPFGFLEHVIRYQVRAIECAELLAVGILAIALNTDFNRCCS